MGVVLCDWVALYSGRLRISSPPAGLEIESYSLGLKNGILFDDQIQDTQFH